MSEFTNFVDTLKTMYEQRMISGSKLRDLVTQGKITSEEYDYIIGKKK